MQVPSQVVNDVLSTQAAKSASVVVEVTATGWQNSLVKSGAGPVGVVGSVGVVGLVGVSITCFHSHLAAKLLHFDSV